MASFTISAPGKVILFGEHAVVYNKTAVAASLDRRSSFNFTELPSEESQFYVEMPKVYVSKKIPLKQIEVLFRNEHEGLRVKDHEKFYKVIHELVITIGFNNEQQRASLECFFYALGQVVQEEDLKIRAFSVKLDTELSIGAGTGSSASFSVCLVAGFLYWSYLQKNPNTSADFDSESLEKICRLAFNCEKIMHGTPSGIDNSICTYGSFIEFQKGVMPKFISFSSNSMLPRNIKILLVDTKVPRSTKLLVSNLAALITEYPETFSNILEAINQLSKQAVDIIKKISSIPESNTESLLNAYKQLSVLVDINQGLLTSCQVSHSSLNLICMIAKTYGFSAKLTGAGGGGFAYVMIPPNASTIQIKDLSSELTSKGFLVTETHLGVAGVTIKTI